ncbi:isopenicillin N synthase family dioxygenase [Paraglaciecola sp. 2405UD69-4]|uniref:isopenicillin N synthase family dioxygenase n=1 Tax=Paraglaciecola sp. 2405UD69-4 TaxID=3391836 RepID=UPI0039C91EC8
MKTPTTKQQNYELQELAREASFSKVSTDMQQVSIPKIDLSDFEVRFESIATQLWDAATQVGFFQLVNHGLPIESINQAFSEAQQFFNLEKSIKSQYPLKKGLNAGWEYMEQVRPSTGVADQKESFQVTLPHMQGLWPATKELPNFQESILKMEQQAWQLGMQVLQCFAYKLGFKRDFFTSAHDRSQKDYQSTLRLLHYLPLPENTQLPENTWRAGAHTDYDCLTMVFQKKGQAGLQVCAGKDASVHQSWCEVEALDEVITCNIGDMLMRWSDDQLKSTLHRVRMPHQGEFQKPRYSMAFFCQANKNITIQGPNKTYEPISAEDYLKMRIAANFSGKG